MIIRILQKVLFVKVDTVSIASKCSRFSTTLPSTNKEHIEKLESLANRLRIDAINATEASSSGHPTSCSSIAEIIAVLFFHIMRYCVFEPKNVKSDRFVLSKGHAAPILYAAWAEAGLFPLCELLTLRKLDSDLEGHPTPRLKFIDVGTGSLGQGLSVAAGMAYLGKYFECAPYRVYCLIGDGESAEGQIWEAIQFSTYYKLDNLCMIFDVNRLGQTQPTALAHNVQAYRERLKAFGCETIILDGHDVKSLIEGFECAENNGDMPTAIVAKTIKGKNFCKIEDAENWHGKPLGKEANKIIKYVTSLIKHPDAKICPKEPPDYCLPSVDISHLAISEPSDYKKGELVATRVAYGTALRKLAECNPRVIGLDGDTRNSTYSDVLRKYDATKFIECFIAEQNLVGVAIGLACRDRAVVFASTFAAFITRAYDQLRMGAISKTNVNIVGSHCGISIGKDGPSQMALEDIAMFRCIPDCTIFYPSDAVSCERAVELAANKKGITYIRTTRPATPVIYCGNQEFQVGKAKIVIEAGDNDHVLVIAAGVTLFEAIQAAKTLRCKSNIYVRVLDPFTIKPIDKNAIIENAKCVGGRIITVEDHYPEGGIGEAVLSAVAKQSGITVKVMAVPRIPRSGQASELLQHYGISAKHIIKAVKKILCK